MTVNPQCATPNAPEFDVAIIGFGPTGATLANLLVLQGVKVVVFERERDVFMLPRAVHFDAECMRVFQTIGIADEMLPELFIGHGMRFVNAQGQLLIDWQRPTSVGPQGWCASYKFHQPHLERTLRAQLARRGGADVRARHEVFAIDPQAGHVRLRFEDMAHGRLSETTARYVVGCDGARSTVRRFMGTELSDMKSHERWVVVDVLLDRERSDLGDYSIQYCDPARPVTYTRGPANRRRWELMVMPGDDDREICTEAWIWAQLKRWISPADGRLERSAIYTFHSVLARGWRHGPLMIAGDAAHQTPPFMGQGMAAGIRDAANLAWKLGAVLQGRAPETLLDTYETEREPHAREFIETAVQLGSVIQATDAAAVEARDNEMTAAIRKFSTPQPRLGAGWYDANCAACGLPSPQPVLEDGTRFDDAVGYRFALAVDTAWQAGLQFALAHMGADLAVVPVAGGPLREWLGQLKARAVLVRPDRYLCAVATDLEELDSLIDRVRVTQGAQLDVAAA